VEHRPLHLHSILVHAAVALAPLAAGAFVLEASSSTVFGIGPAVWTFLLRGSLIGLFLIALPSIATGISERNHMYVNWPPSHRIKLTLSLALVLLVGFELVAVLASDAPLQLRSWLALAVIVGNCAVVFALSAYGLRITLGRQSLARTSYQPDMDFDPPMNILDCVAEFAADPPKLIDVREEG
jgi:FtsH-binding integral membrane protein